MSVQCPTCGVVAEENAFKCRNCGGPIRVASTAVRSGCLCEHCGFQAPPGSTVCPQCFKSMRPLGLTILGFTLLIGSLLLVVFSVYSVLDQRLLTIVAEVLVLWLIFVFWMTANVLLGAWGVFAAWHLLNGQYAGWTSTRTLWVVSCAENLLALLYFMAIGNAEQITGLGMLLTVRLLLAATLWHYWHSARVLDFLSGGRPHDVEV